MGLLSVQLVSKISNLCDHNPPTSQTDRLTDRRHAITRPRICTKVHCAVIKLTHTHTHSNYCYFVICVTVTRCLQKLVKKGQDSHLRDLSTSKIISVAAFSWRQCKRATVMYVASVTRVPLFLVSVRSLRCSSFRFRNRRVEL